MISLFVSTRDFAGASDSKEFACNAGDPVWSLGQQDSWRRKWQPTPVFLLGESHGQRSLVGYSSWSHKELDTTEWLTLHFHLASYKQESAAATAPESLQSCPTLCNPINGSPRGSPVPGILQARTLEWVAISFSNAWKWKVRAKLLSHVWLLAAPWTAAHQAPPSMGFSRQECWIWRVGIVSPVPMCSFKQHSYKSQAKQNEPSPLPLQGCLLFSKLE